MKKKGGRETFEKRQRGAVYKEGLSISLKRKAGSKKEEGRLGIISGHMLVAVIWGGESNVNVEGGKLVRWPNSIWLEKTL